MSAKEVRRKGLLGFYKRAETLVVSHFAATGEPIKVSDLAREMGVARTTIQRRMTHAAERPGSKLDEVVLTGGGGPDAMAFVPKEQTT